MARLLPCERAMAKPRKRDFANTPVNSPETGAAQHTGDIAAATLDRDRVAARAYEIYQERGGTDGMDLDDWLQAERELMQRHS